MSGRVTYMNIPAVRSDKEESFEVTCYIHSLISVSVSASNCLFVRNDGLLITLPPTAQLEDHQRPVRHSQPTRRSVPLLACRRYLNLIPK